MASTQLNDSISRLHAQYQPQAGSVLPREQFITLLTFFPVLLVVNADAHLQEEERIFVTFIAKAMADTFDQELPDRAARAQLQQQFTTDLDYLLHHHQWEAPFMETLANYLAEMPQIKETVLEVIYLFADAAEETSAAEARTIGQIRARLGI